MDTKKQKVLILCSGNSARSQIAEGFLRQMAGDRFEVMSAGTEPASEINPLAIEVMQEAGIDISSQHPKDLTLYLGKEFIHYLIIVCNKAQETCPRIWPGLFNQDNRLYWPIDDPASVEGTDEEKREAFRRSRNEIKQKLESWMATL